MFNGLNTQNTPTYQIRTFGLASGTALLGLPDDCAPLQILYLYPTATTPVYRLNLPTNPNPGKRITLMVLPYNQSTTDQSTYTLATVAIYDNTDSGSTASLITLGIGATVDLIYVPQQARTLTDTTGGVYSSNWITLGSTTTKYPNFTIGATNSRQVMAGQSNLIVGGDTNTVRGTGNFNSVVGGYNNNVGAIAQTTSYSNVSGGTANTVNGSYSVISGGQNNTINYNGGDSSTIGGGYNNSITGYRYGIIPGGNGNSITGGDTAILGHGCSASSGVAVGQAITVSGTSASGIGYNHTVAHARACIVGTEGGSSRQLGYVGWASAIPVLSAARGAFQAGNLVMGKDTTDATTTSLVCSWISGGQISLVNNSAYYFRIMVVATITGGGNTKQWFIEGLVKRGASAATTAFVGTPSVTSTFADAGAAAWTVAVVADTTNGGVNINVTGAAATSIRWMARTTTAEVTY